MTPRFSDEDHLQRELQVGFDQADAGDMAAWDIEEMLQEARRRRSSSEAQKPKQTGTEERNP